MSDTVHRKLRVIQQYGNCRRQLAVNRRGKVCDNLQTGKSCLAGACLANKAKPSKQGKRGKQSCPSQRRPSRREETTASLAKSYNVGKGLLVLTVTMYMV